MARKIEKAAKPLTTEQKKQDALEQYFFFKKHKSMGEPTYIHNIGDHVKIGNLKNCVVFDVQEIDREVVYGFSYGENSDNYMYDAWYNVRKDSPRGITNFSSEDEVRISFYNSTLESLLQKYYLSGVDMSPSYQRDYVWDDKDKESLLDSIFSHIEIGKFAFIEKDYTSDVSFEILDGKQRLSTLLAFYENRFPYKGAYFDDLSPKDRHTFLNANVSIGTTREMSEDQIYKYFYTLNKCGKVMDEAHLEHIKELIQGEKEENEVER